MHTGGCIFGGSAVLNHSRYRLHISPDDQHSNGNRGSLPEGGVAKQGGGNSLTAWLNGGHGGHDANIYARTEQGVNKGE